MIQITDTVSIEEHEIKEEFIRSSGPGGQNVNKVATTVQLRFDIRNSSLPDDIREHLLQLAGRRVNEAGELIVTARRFRTQARNREDAINRLVDLIRKASQQPKPRKKRKPSFAAKQQRLEEKRRLSQKKQWRRFDPESSS